MCKTIKLVFLGVMVLGMLNFSAMLANKVAPSAALFSRTGNSA